MPIVKSSLPDRSLLKIEEKTYDYVDSFQGNFIDQNGNVDATKIGKSFFTSAPGWIDRLFSLRNRLIRPLGLKTSEPTNERETLLDSFKCQPGNQIGLFKVFHKTNDEVILGEDDKHLNFRVSLFINQEANNKTSKRLTISTAVKFNNWFGRLYFLIVRPFHELIVQAILKRMIKMVENQNK